MARHVLTLFSPVVDNLAEGGSRPAVVRYVELSDVGAPLASLFLPYAEFLDLGAPSQIELDPTPGPDSETVPVTTADAEAAAGTEVLEETGTSAEPEPVP